MQADASGPFRAGGEGSGRGAANQGEARHRDVMETSRKGRGTGERRERWIVRDGERESEAFSRWSGFKMPL